MGAHVEVLGQEAARQLGPCGLDLHLQESCLFTIPLLLSSPKFYFNGFNLFSHLPLSWHFGLDNNPFQPFSFPSSNRMTQDEDHIDLLRPQNLFSLCSLLSPPPSASLTPHLLQSNQ